MGKQKDQQTCRPKKYKCTFCSGDLEFHGHQTVQLRCGNSICKFKPLNLTPMSPPTFTETPIKFKGFRQFKYENQQVLKPVKIKNNFRQEIQKRFGQNSYSTVYHYSSKLPKKFYVDGMAYRNNEFYQKVIKPITQHQQYLPLRIADSVKANGKGVFATGRIRRGQYTLAYIGQIINQMEHWPPTDSVYQMGYWKQNNQINAFVIQPVRKLNAGRYINSDLIQNCNLDIERVICNNEMYLLLRANRDIQIGQQLFYHYGADYSNNKGQFDPSNSQNLSDNPGWVSETLNGRFPPHIQKIIFYSLFCENCKYDDSQGIWSLYRIQGLRKTKHVLQAMTPKQKFLYFIKIRQTSIKQTNVYLKTQLTSDEKQQAYQWFILNQGAYFQRRHMSSEKRERILRNLNQKVQINEYYPQIEYLQQLEVQCQSLKRQNTTVVRRSLIEYEQLIKKAQSIQNNIAVQLQQTISQIKEKAVYQMKVKSKSFEKSPQWNRDRKAVKQVQQIQMEMIKNYQQTDKIKIQYIHPLRQQIQDIIEKYYSKSLTDIQIKAQINFIEASYGNQRLMMQQRVYGNIQPYKSGNGRQTTSQLCKLCRLRIPNHPKSIINHLNLNHKGYIASINQLKSLGKQTFLITSNQIGFTPIQYFCRKAAKLNFAELVEQQNSKVLTVNKYSLIKVKRDGTRVPLQQSTPPPKRDYQKSWNFDLQVEAKKKIKQNEQIQISNNHIQVKPSETNVMKSQFRIFGGLFGFRKYQSLDEEGKCKLLQHMARDQRIRQQNFADPSCKIGYLNYIQRQLRQSIGHNVFSKINQKFKKATISDVRWIDQFLKSIDALDALLTYTNTTAQDEEQAFILYQRRMSSTYNANHRAVDTSLDILLRRINPQWQKCNGLNTKQRERVLYSLNSDISRIVRELTERNTNLIMERNLDYIRDNINSQSQHTIFSSIKYVIDYSIEIKCPYSQYTQRFCSVLSAMLTRQNILQPEQFEFMVANQLRKSQSPFYNAFSSSNNDRQHLLFCYIIKCNRFKKYAHLIFSLYRTAKRQLITIAQTFQQFMSGNASLQDFQQFTHSLQHSQVMISRHNQITALSKILKSDSQKYLIQQYYRLTQIKRQSEHNKTKASHCRNLITELLYNYFIKKYTKDQRDFKDQIKKCMAQLCNSQKTTIHLTNTNDYYYLERANVYCYYKVCLDHILAQIQMDGFRKGNSAQFQKLQNKIRSQITQSIQSAITFIMAIQKGDNNPIQCSLILFRESDFMSKEDIFKKIEFIKNMPES